MNKARIWELDVLRGIALAGMLAVHLLYDLTDLTGVLTLQFPSWYHVLRDYGGAVFLLISGICAGFGSRHLRRGAVVFSGGMLCTAVTLGIYLAGLSDISIVIWFGALHCLGLCMLLWPLFRNMKAPALALIGAALAAAGIWSRQHSFDVSPLLIPLGFAPGWFATSDYFPLPMNLGWFLLGAAAGKRWYPERVSLLPNIDSTRQPLALLGAMGRHSLVIYLLHQPLLAALAFGLKLIL